MTIPRPNPAGRFSPEDLFRPDSVAVLGAETDAGSQILANLAMSGFKNRLQVARQVEELEPGTRLAILAGEPDSVVPTLAGLPARGCHAAIVPGAVEGGSEALVLAARDCGVRVLGPCSFGLAVPALGLNATRSHLAPPAGRLALVSQSDALCRVVIDWAGPNGIGFSHVVGIGDNADIGFGMVLDWLSRDPGTGMIMLDIRRLKDHRAFLSAARAAARLRPVVAIRAGGLLRDPAGAANLAFEAALRRAGVLSVASLEDLLAAAETLSRARPVRTEALAIVTNAIGPGLLTADAALRNGIALPPDAAEGMCVVSPGQEARLAAEIQSQASDPAVGGILVVHAPTTTSTSALTGLAEVAARIPVPLLACVMGETTGAVHRANLAAQGLPVFSGPEQAVRGFAYLVRNRRNRAAARELPPSTVLALAPDRTAVRRLFHRVRASGRTTLMQDEALEVLASYGIPVLPSRAVSGPEDAAAAAALVGFPTVVKLRQDLPPATRPAFGLMLDLHDARDVTAAARILTDRAERQGTPPMLLVQRQAGRAREFAVRVADDPTFGPVIGFGPGGTNPEDQLAVALDLPPLNLSLATALVGRSRPGARMDQPLRDRPAGRVKAMAEILVRISQMVVDFPEIEIFEASSLFADAQGVTAADAWIRLRDAGVRPPVLAIAPYPTELTGSWQSRGESFTIRPIRPEDAECHAAMFKRLSPEDIRFRFFSAVRELSADQMVRLTQVDYDREMAFVAVQAATGDTIGVCRLVIEPDRRSGEFAVIIQADLKGRGLATHLMQRLIAWARIKALGEITGQVLSNNAPMLAFVRRLGFQVRRMIDDPEVMEVRLSLTADDHNDPRAGRPQPGH